VVDEPKEAKNEQDEEFSLWMCQVQIFFTKLFAAYQHEKVLREKIKENRIQDAEIAELRKIKDEELAQLIAEREAEEAKRQEAASAAATLDSESADFKEPVTQLVPCPKKAAQRAARPASATRRAGKKGKKK
ncbi:RS10B protein, partial [Atlantisia rogersi]|nr:RS10B protein [Atlantisia rogersi]